MTKPPFMSRWFSDLYWKPLLFTIPPLTLLLFLTVSLTPINPFSSFAPLAFHFLNKTASVNTLSLAAAATTTKTTSNYSSIAPSSLELVNRSASTSLNNELGRSRMAVCLVGGARRFELTGLSIVKNILHKVYPNSDLFLHSNFDDKAFKFSLLKSVPRLASVRIIHPKPLPETLPQLRVLITANSPNGIQVCFPFYLP
ncbi:hypothetical protein Peur_025882 [Populus x canadensis]